MRLQAFPQIETKNMSSIIKSQDKVIEFCRLSPRDTQILQVAARIFAKRGYRNTDVQEIADELGIGKATIYRAFGTKEELFFATVDNGMSRLNELMCAHKSKENNEFSTE